MITETWLQKEYVENKRNRCDIGRELGVTEGCIERWLKKYQIPIRSWQAATNIRFDLENMPTTLTKNEEQILYGSMMGDGYIEKKASGACHYSETHNVKQKEYLEWKGEQLKRFRARVQIINRKIGKATGLWTSPAPILRDLHKQFYTEHKIVTRELLNSIDKLGLAIWYQDDGSLNAHRYVEIYTCSFTNEEHLIMQKWFKEKWDLNVTIAKNRQYNLLRFTKEETNKFFKIIGEYMHKSMLYKIDCNKQEKNSVKHLIVKGEIYA